MVLGGSGPAPRDRLVGAVGPKTVVVAADSGLEAAMDARIVVHHVVGDLDSVALAALTVAERAGAEIHRHPSDKDATDGELALDLAVDVLTRSSETRAAPHLVVVGGGGGRLDHLLGDVMALLDDRLVAFDVTAHLGPATLTVVRPGRSRSLVGRPGEVVSLLAPRSAARGVTTRGMRWPLDDGDLAAGSTRGTSNEMVSDEAHVSLRHGTLVAILPGHLARSVEPRSSAYDPSPRLEDGFGGSEGHRPQ